MRRTWVILVAVVATFPLMACGTVRNLTGWGYHSVPDQDEPDLGDTTEPWPRVYGGVQIDSGQRADSTVDWPDLSQVRGKAVLGLPYVLAGALGIWSCEVALSVVADTATLPITIPVAIRNKAELERRTADLRQLQNTAKPSPERGASTIPYNPEEPHTNSIAVPEQLAARATKLPNQLDEVKPRIELEPPVPPRWSFGWPDSGHLGSEEQTPTSPEK